jgi:hypothetical protein
MPQIRVGDKCVYCIAQDLRRPSYFSEEGSAGLSVEPHRCSGYISCYKELSVTNAAQKRALKTYRDRLSERGLARFEVLGLEGDRDLIRSLAKCLAEDSPEAARIRASVATSISGEPPRKGGILAALRRSPLVGADIDVERPIIAGRMIDL